jgi:hypothetical protein
MTLESFHLTIGMSRTAALESVGPWNPKQGKDENETVVDYKSDRALTLEFRNGRLHSVRFELYVLLPQARQAFADARALLAETRGKPPKESRSLVVYDNALPNVMAVVSDDPASENGKKGVGIVALRYYDPR